jgi:hypothetical protein
MLEPVSAAIGLGVVGVQVGATAYRLQKLWGEMKEVPDNIRHLLEQLKIVSSQLSNAELLPSSARVEQQCLDRCQEAHKELTRVASELENQLQARGKFRQKTVALKAIMNQDILKKHERRLKAALNMLKLDLQISAMYFLLSPIIKQKARIPANSKSRNKGQETTELLHAQTIQNSTHFSAQNAHAKAVTATLSVITESQAEARCVFIQSYIYINIILY